MTGTARLLLAVAAALAAAGGCAGRGAAPAAVRVGGLTVLEERPSSAGAYAGSDACRGCHPGPWERWSGTGHAGPLAGLPAGEAAPACLRCHATGYGERSGYGGRLAPPGLGAVGCEACHGPGAEHAASRWPSLVPPPLVGTCSRCDLGRVCRGCHTPARSPGFELAGGLRRVACGGSAPGAAQP